eukprot:1158372-Pelagomonas_calceolata.AAC.4
MTRAQCFWALEKDFVGLGRCPALILGIGYKLSGPLKHSQRNRVKVGVVVAAHQVISGQDLVMNSMVHATALSSQCPCPWASSKT